MPWDYAIVVSLSYLLGSVPPGLVAGRLLKGVDIRAYGSGRTGFTNSLRMLGFRVSFFVLLADFLKGLIPFLVAWAVFNDPNIQVAAGIAAVVGHVWPVFAGFRGGRGVATTYAVYMGMNAPVTCALVLFAFAMIYVFRYMSLMSVVTIPLGALAFFLLALSGLVPHVYAVCAAIAAALVVFQHRDNIERLLSGTEPKIGQGTPRQPVA